MKTATKVQKQVQIIARVQIKRNGIVVYKVRSSNGNDIYETTFFEGKATGCSCPATKPCYHMTQLQAREDERKAALEAVADMAVDLDALVAATFQTKTAPRQQEDWGLEEEQAASPAPTASEIKVSLREAGYEFRLFGASRNAWHWMPQYRKDGGEWQNVPSAKEDVDWRANEVLWSFQKSLYQQPAPRLSREAYNDLFSPCTVPGMY